MADEPSSLSQRKPPWLRVRAPAGEGYRRLAGILDRHGLHTVCSSASCPNVGECWSAGVATVMILGERCSRDCRFCGVAGGAHGPADPDEPARVAAAVAEMGLRHVVMTSVTRDDLPDGGSAIWAQTISAVRQACPETVIETLVPDFMGRRDDCRRVFDARPDILGHNVETVPSLYPLARPAADFERSLLVLDWARQAALTTKSGLMVGLGESEEEVLDVLRRLREAAVRIVTIGQYLRPTAKHLPVSKYVTPEQFDRYARQAEAMGFDAVASGPLVRSSYQADRHARAAGVASRPGQAATAGPAESAGRPCRPAPQTGG